MAESFVCVFPRVGLPPLCSPASNSSRTLGSFHHDWWRHERVFDSKLSLVFFLSVLRCFGIWPSYWTASPGLPASKTHKHLSLKCSAFRAWLINRCLFWVSQQPMVNPVTLLCVRFCGCLSVCMWLVMGELFFILGGEIMVSFSDPQGEFYWLLGVYFKTLNHFRESN